MLGKSELEKLGFSSAQRHVPGLLIPLWGVDGINIVGYQFRPDSPRLNSKGRPVKYETPRGAINRIDCPPSSDSSLDNRRREEGLCIGLSRRMRY